MLKYIYIYNICIYNIYIYIYILQGGTHEPVPDDMWEEAYLSSCLRAVSGCVCLWEGGGVGGHYVYCVCMYVCIFSYLYAYNVSLCVCYVSLCVLCMIFDTNRT